MSGLYFHGVSTNLKKFMSILASGVIMSPNFLRNHQISGLPSHPNTTSGQDRISLALANTPSYDTYIKPGIAFIIGDILVISGIRGALDGEVYARDFVPLKAIQGIYVNPDLAERKLKDIDLCALDYGSTSLESKIRYMLGLSTDDNMSSVMSDYYAHNARIEKEIQDLMQEQNRAPRAQKREFRDKIIEKTNELKELEASLGQSCTRAFLDELVIRFGIQNIYDMTLGEFLSMYLNVIAGTL